MEPQPPLLELSRRVRFCINPGLATSSAVSSPRHNTFAAWPGMVGLGAFYEMEVRCRGEADPVTGYLMNISLIDECVRRIALPIVHEAMRRDPLTEPAIALRSIIAPLSEALDGRLDSVRWRLTPYHSITMNAAATDRVLIAQQFEFAAAHRLHIAELSADENRAVFGRCNNPHSHGHNYRMEAAVSAPLADEGVEFTVAHLERIVNERIIQRFDHSNLNVDVAEFAKVNPSVENIAKVCYELLHEAIHGAGAELSHVTVWETEKTSCTYPSRRRT